jgi:hypothetical protein
VTAHWVVVMTGDATAAVDAMVSVVLRPFRAVAEDMVGRGNVSEAIGSVWIGAVAVWVVF